MNCYRERVKPAVCFGLGILVAALLPLRWTLVAAAAALILVSISCNRR